MDEISQRGIALVVTLILLLTLSVLVVMSVSTASAELIMSGNEQHIRNAANAAGAGVERALTRLVTRAEMGELEGPAGQDRYVATVRAMDEERQLPGMSVERFVGRHFEIESTGYGSRHAVDVQVQGVMIIEATAGVHTFSQQVSGL